MTIGGIFKATIPDETDDERREIERCVVLKIERPVRPTWPKITWPFVRLVLNAETKNKKRKEKEKESKREKEKAGWFAGSTKKDSPSSDKHEKVEGDGRPWSP